MIIYNNNNIPYNTCTEPQYRFLKLNNTNKINNVILQLNQRIHDFYQMLINFLTNVIQPITLWVRFCKLKYLQKVLSFFFFPPFVF